MHLHLIEMHLHLIEMHLHLIEMHLHVRLNHIRIQNKRFFWYLVQMLAVPGVPQHRVDPNTFCSL